ncbi:MAG TPA: DUF5666 domain-containing protein [Bryobacteraceae bacterium]|nr:DUF5666 domain-containing protein [Bryobacteraceae bacterium]
MTRLVFLCLAFLTGLAAQQSASREPRVISGTLVATAHNSISVKLNRKITTVQLTPDTEIWRRGIDFTAPSHLVLGDDIYVLYEQTSTDGAPLATLIAAPEEGDSVALVPRHVVENRVCDGYLTAAGINTIAIKNDEGTCIMRFTPDTVFWRGGASHGPGALVVGDEIGARAQVNYPNGELIAEEVIANLGKFSGTITGLHPHSVEIAREDEHGDPDGPATVYIDGRTAFNEGTAAELEVGAFLEVIGLDLGDDSMRATTIMTLKPPAPPPSRKQ